MSTASSTLIRPSRQSSEPTRHDRPPQDRARRRFLWLCAALLGAYGLIFAGFVPGRTDEYWDHTAAIHALQESFGQPAHPLLAGSPAGDRWFCPYLVALAGVSRLTGLSPVGVMKVGGLLNLLLLCWGLRAFARALFPARSAPAWMLLTYLLFWTTRGAMLRELAYSPASFVAAAGFLYWALGARVFSANGRTAELAALALGVVMWLSHQLAATVVFASVAILAAVVHDAPTARRWRFGLGVPVAAVLLGELWPYYSSLRLVWASGMQYGAGAPALNIWRELSIYLALLGPNLIGIGLLAWRRAATAGERFLKLTAALFGLAWAALLAIRSPYHTAAMLAMGNASALWVGHELSGGVPGRSPAWLRPGLLACLGLAVALQVKFTAGWFHQMYGTPDGARYRQMLAEYPRVAQALGPSAVVFSDVWTAWQLPTFGGKVVTRPPGHEVDYHLSWAEQQRRVQDVERFFAPGTSEAARRELIARYGATHVLLNRVLAPGAGRRLEGVAHPIMSTPHLTLLRVDRP